MLGPQCPILCVQGAGEPLVGPSASQTGVSSEFGVMTASWADARVRRAADLTAHRQLRAIAMLLQGWRGLWGHVGQY